MYKLSELESWKSARQLRIAISDLVKSFPADEKFRLKDQIIRSSRSIPANIAEGYGRFHYQENIQFCKRCHNISDSDLCSICNNPKRDSTLVCVVQDIRDVMAIESTGQFFGEYHVLGGVISPMDGIGPEDLTITSLLDRIDTFNVKEIIFGLPATMEGDTTNFFIYRKIQDKKIKTSLISRGIGVGNQLEYIDEITLGKSIVNRSPYEINFSS